MFNNAASRDLHQNYLDLTSIPSSLEYAEADSLLDFFKEITQKFHLLSDDYRNLTYSIKKILNEHRAIFNFEHCAFVMMNGPFKDQIFSVSDNMTIQKESVFDMTAIFRESVAELMQLTGTSSENTGSVHSTRSFPRCRELSNGSEVYLLYPYISNHMQSVFAAKCFRNTLVTVRKLYELICLNSMQAMDQIIENNNLRSQISHDYLTQLHNKEAFDNALDRELGRANRFKTSFVLLLFDLDKFKSINDELGYLTGDRVIRAVGDVFRENTRKIDFTARIGGDEFSMILPGVDPMEITNFVGRLNVNFKKKLAEINKSISSALSFGLSTYPADGEERAQLFRTANDRLKSSKTSR